MGILTTFATFALILFAAEPGWCQTIEEIANSLHVSFKLDENYSPVSGKYTASITLRNIGEGIIQSGDWSIFFCNVRMLEADGLIGDNIVPKPTGYAIPDTGFTLFHVAGCLFRLQPNEDFSDLASGAAQVIQHVGQSWMIARSDIMPNFYVASPDGQSALILNTADETISFAAPFTNPRQYKRIEADQFAPYSPQVRYDRYFANDLGNSTQRIVPLPLRMNVEMDPNVHIDTSWVVFDATESFEATFLAEKLGITVATEAPSEKFIQLTIDASVAIAGCENNAERYTVQIQLSQITITGTNSAGVFYGVQSLLAAVSEENVIGTGSIEDCPRFGYRGFMIDVGRHFIPMEEVLRVLDVMAMYKLNKFHFHLSDDEGFRIEINGLPELTTVGATQCHDVTEDECIMPQLGSPPTKESTGSGYFTEEEYKGILMYANDRHIQVIPEVDMPGHAHAIIKAMEHRNRTFDDPTYVVWDPEDTTKYLSVQYFTDNAMNPCINSTYTFVETIIDAFIELHRDIQDLQIFHWGGDEIPGAWADSPACKEFVENDPSLPNNATGTQLKDYFALRVEDLTTKKGLDSAAWEDGMIMDDGNPLPIPETQKSYVYAWSNVWDWGNGKLAYVFANADYQSVISHATHLYFDHPVEPDPEDIGYYWATRYTDTYKTFSFVASDIYKNIGIDGFGSQLDPEEICQEFGCPPLQKPENIVGIQGQLWSETARTTEYFHGNVFPRLVALAERAWHRSDWENENITADREDQTKEDWEGFANRLGYRELSRLDALGVKYDIRPPAVLTNNDQLTVKTEFPGLQVDVSTDWGLTWFQYYPGMPVPSTDAIFATKSADGSRRSRPVKYNAPQPPQPGQASSIKAGLLTVLCLTFTVNILF